MAPLPAFTVIGTINDVVGDLLAGELKQRALFGATVTFTSNLTDTDFVVWDDELNNFAKSVVATVASDGTILRKRQPVKLLANDAGLNVDGIQWEVSVIGRDGKKFHSFWFDAEVDGGTVDLAGVARVPGATPSPTFHTAWSEITGKPAVIASGADAAAARAAIGASTAGDITTAVNALLAGAPGALDTLNELAAALGDDANFAATIATALTNKQPIDDDLTAIAALTTASFGRSLLTPADATAGRALLGDPLFIDVASAQYGGVVPATSNPEVGIQAAIDYAGANGIPEVIISRPGTYTVDLHVIPGQSFYAAAIWGVSNVKLTMKTGVVIKLKNSATLPGGATSGQIIGNSAVAQKTNWAVEGGVVDGNAANQSVFTIDGGVVLNACRSSYVKDVVVKNIYGTASAPPGESLHFEATKCRDVRFINCEADGSGSGNTATGFSTNQSFGVTWDACVSHNMGFGMGFTCWQSSGLRYANCHAYSNGHSGFNAERSEDITYSSCIAGGRSPFIDGTSENSFFPSGQVALGNLKGFHIHGCTDVAISGCVSTYNGTNLHIKTNVGMSPNLICTRVIVAGCDLRQGTTANVSIEKLSDGGSNVDQVEVHVVNCLGGANTDTDWIYNSSLAPIVEHVTGTSGLRYYIKNGGGTWAVRWITNAFDGALSGFADAGLLNSGQWAAGGFIATETSTPTAAGTTTLTIDSTQTQVFTGSTTQNVNLPTTGVIAGQQYTIVNQSSGNVTVQSSGANAIAIVGPGFTGIFVAQVDTPTTAANWRPFSPYTFSSASTLAMRDGSANLLADAFIPSQTSTPTAAGTTTLTVDSKQTQTFTGATTQTVKLPTSSIIVGMQYTINNQSSGAVTVQSSGANTIATVAAGALGIFMAAADTPTTAANWKTIFNA